MCIGCEIQGNYAKYEETVKEKLDYNPKSDSTYQ